MKILYRLTCAGMALGASLEIFTGTVQDGRITGEARAGNATAAVRWSASLVQ